jgi:hypothetical protein
MDQAKAAALDRIGEPVVDKVCEKAFELVKENATKDPDMPGCVKRTIGGALEIMKPEVKQELHEALCSAVRRKKEIDHGEPNACGCSPRAFVLYHYYPYNRSIWYKLKDPVWWVFTIIAAIQFYCIRSVWFVFLFLLIDKKDEYQLLNLILTFKGTQVVSGIVAGLVGAFNFFVCVGITRKETTVILGDIKDSETLTTAIVSSDSCAENGPGVTEGWIFSVVTLTIHAVLCWVAFLMLCCAKKKGRIQMLTEKEEEEPVPCCGDPSKGGGLRRFLWYDTFTVVLCLGLLLLAFYLQETTDVDDVLDLNNWLLQLNLYWIKVTYLLLAFPFLFLKLPFVDSVLLHARPTGYNPYGKCVPLLPEDEFDPAGQSKV